MSNQIKFINNLNYKDYKYLSSRYILNFNQELKLKKITNNKVLFKNTINLFYIILKIIFNFIYANTQNFRSKINKSSNINHLIISHFDNNKNSDYIFGDIFSNEYLKNNFIVYVTNLDNKSKKSKISPLFFKLNLFSQFKIIFSLYGISLNILLGKSFKNFYENYYQFKFLSKSYMEYDTFCNLLIFEYTKKHINSFNIDSILTTFEGHPWEVLIFFYSNHKKIKSSAYLHTYLKKNSPYFFLSKNYVPNVIYTVGREMANVVNRFLGISFSQIKILGSKKHNSDKVYEYIQNNKTFKNILLLPESIDEEVDIFLKFIDHCKSYRNLNIKIKFHPLYSINNYIIKNYNDYITQSQLDDIIINTDLIIYRGTSTIFELMKFKVISLYLSNDNETTRDPLFYCNDKFIISNNNIKNFLNLDNNSTKDKLLINEFNVLRKKMFDYYEPINREKLP